MVYVVACFHQWALSIIWIRHWRDIRLCTFYVFWHRHMWVHRTLDDRTGWIAACWAHQLNVIHFQGLHHHPITQVLTSRWVRGWSIRWRLSTEHLETTNVRVVSWLYAVRSFDASNRAPNHRPKWVKDVKVTAMQYLYLRTWPTLRPRSGSPDFFVPFAPCGVPFDCLKLALCNKLNRTIRVATGFAFAFAFGFARPSQRLRCCR